MARRICTIVEINSIKNRHLNELRENFRTYGYSEKKNDFVKSGVNTPAEKTLMALKASS